MVINASSHGWATLDGLQKQDKAVRTLRTKSLICGHRHPPLYPQVEQQRHQL